MKPVSGLKTPVEIISRSERARGPRATFDSSSAFCSLSARSLSGIRRSTSSPPCGSIAVYSVALLIDRPPLFRRVLVPHAAGADDAGRVQRAPRRSDPTAARPSPTARSLRSTHGLSRGTARDPFRRSPAQYPTPPRAGPPVVGRRSRGAGPPRGLLRSALASPPVASGALRAV